ncbi:MAG: glycosyltransferase family 4 protein [Clostridiales bacterium]|nr:glycosyltransferase family 4 protein [Eubacteriales bacterium]MDH7565643.1 glycosyltransferase family 4 protein [Clostridiales bacterium]
MNIALISSEKLPVPPIAGGAVQLYIDGILPYISKHHNITVFSIDYPGLPQEEEKDGVRYIRVPAKDEMGYVNNLKNKLTKNFDLVHVFNRPAWVLELSSVLPGTRFSLSLHNEMFATEKLPPAKAVECISKLEFINTVSRFIADRVKNLYPEAESKLNVVYSGADTDKYKPNWTKEGAANKKRLKEKYKIQNYRVVLFVGRLSVKKGVHVLLKAMKRVMDVHRNVALVIIGSKWYGGNMSDDYTKSVENLSKSLTGPIVFTGFLPPSEVISHYNLGDIFVCASQWNEPLARVHYEAMAAGLPIITTNRGGNAEVVSGKGNGLVVDDYSNPDALADSIDYFLNRPSKIQEMGRTGRMLAERMYSWERVATEVLQAFARVEEKLKVPAKGVEEIPRQKIQQKLENGARVKPLPNKEAAPQIKTLRKTETASQAKSRQKTEAGRKTAARQIDYSALSETYRNYLEKWRNRNY